MGIVLNALRKLTGSKNQDTTTQPAAPAPAPAPQAPDAIGTATNAIATGKTSTADAVRKAVKGYKHGGKIGASAYSRGGKVGLRKAAGC